MADQFLLLGIDRNHGVARAHTRAYLSIDVLKLRVPVRMAGTFDGLPIRLQAVAQLLQQLTDLLMRDAMALSLQLRRQMAHALARPAQRRLRIASRGRLDQLLQVAQQCRVFIPRALPSAAGFANPARSARAGGLAQLRQPSSNRVPRHPGRARDDRDASRAQDLRFAALDFLWLLFS